MTAPTIDLAAAKARRILAAIDADDLTLAIVAGMIDMEPPEGRRPSVVLAELARTHPELVTIARQAALSVAALLARRFNEDNTTAH